MEQEIEYRGYKIQIHYDQSAENPRTLYDNYGVMCCWHSRYNLGDSESWKDSSGKRKSKQLSDNYQEPIDLLYELAGIDRNEYQEQEYEKIGKWDDMSYEDLYTKIEEKGTIISPLYLYDHSGITISMGSFGCRFDSGQVGYIYMTKETIEKEEWTPEQAMKYMEGGVEVYDNYLTGEVYGWVVEDADEDEIDRCSGYYGDEGVKDAIAEAKSTIDKLVENKHKKDLLLGIQIELAI